MAMAMVVAPVRYNGRLYPPEEARDLIIRDELRRSGDSAAGTSEQKRCFQDARLNDWLNMMLTHRALPNWQSCNPAGRVCWDWVIDIAERLHITDVLGKATIIDRGLPLRELPMDPADTISSMKRKAREIDGDGAGGGSGGGGSAAGRELTRDVATVMRGLQAVSEKDGMDVTKVVVDKDHVEVQRERKKKEKHKKQRTADGDVSLGIDAIELADDCSASRAVTISDVYIVRINPSIVGYIRRTIISILSSLEQKNTSFRTRMSKLLRVEDRIKEFLKIFCDEENEAMSILSNAIVTVVNAEMFEHDNTRAYASVGGQLMRAASLQVIAIRIKFEKLYEALLP